MRICPNPKCGKTIENDKAKFCRYCGMELANTPNPKESAIFDDVLSNEEDHTHEEGIVLSPTIGTDNTLNPDLSGDPHPNADGISLGFASDANSSHFPLKNNDGTNKDNQSYGNKKPNNYLVLAILSTVFCCIPLGIYAIVCAAKVNTLYFAGDIVGAQKASEKAKNWSIISAVVTIIAWFIIYIASNSSSGY